MKKSAENQTKRRPAAALSNPGRPAPNPRLSRRSTAKPDHPWLTLPWAPSVIFVPLTKEIDASCEDFSDNFISYPCPSVSIRGHLPFGCGFAAQGSLWLDLDSRPLFAAANDPKSGDTIEATLGTLIRPTHLSQSRNNRQNNHENLSKIANNHE
jgi:hypothetical protein